MLWEKFNVAINRQKPSLGSIMSICENLNGGTVPGKTIYLIVERKLSIQAPFQTKVLPTAKLMHLKMVSDKTS